MCPLHSMHLVTRQWAFQTRAGHTRAHGRVRPGAAEPAWWCAAPPRARCGHRHSGGAGVHGPQPRVCQPCTAPSHIEAGCALAKPAAGVWSHHRRSAWRPRLQWLQRWPWSMPPPPPPLLHLNGAPRLVGGAAHTPLHPCPAHQPPCPTPAPARRRCVCAQLSRPRPQMDRCMARGAARWTHWDLNTGLSACGADVIPLHHVPEWRW